jgi:hypothetical protein
MGLNGYAMTAYDYELLLVIIIVIELLTEYYSLLRDSAMKVWKDLDRSFYKKVMSEHRIWALKIIISIDNGRRCLQSLL